MSAWWEARRPGEQTTVYLGRVLDALELGDMARRAREGHFDDYFAPAEVADGMELQRLVAELEHVARGTNRLRIRELIAAVKAGEFDATREESDRWAASADGQQTMRMLLEGG